MSSLIKKFVLKHPVALLAILSTLTFIGTILYIQFKPEAMSSGVWVLMFAFAGLIVALIAGRIKSGGKWYDPGFLIALLILLVFLGVFSYIIFWPENVLAEFSGGEGETTTEVFALESPGEMYLSESAAGGSTPYIKVKVYEEGMSDPIHEVTSSLTYSDGMVGVSLASVRLDPGSYYLKIESNLEWWKLNIKATD